MAIVFTIACAVLYTTTAQPAGILQVWKDSIENGGKVLPSQLFRPRTGHAPHPVIVFLHGGGDGPFDVMNRQSLPSLLLNNQTFADTFPFIVITPCSTCSGGSHGWTAQNFAKIEELVSRVIVQYKGDPTRVSLTGQSMGGGGLWHYASKHIWSALVPVCASIRPTQALADAACCKGPSRGCCPPVWAFHGANDQVVPVAATDRMVEMLRAQNHRQQGSVAYTKYPDAPPPPMREFANLIGHGSYELAYRDARLYEWLLQQRCEECAQALKVAQ